MAMMACPHSSNHIGQKGPNGATANRENGLVNRLVRLYPVLKGVTSLQVASIQNMAMAAARIPMAAARIPRNPRIMRTVIMGGATGQIMMWMPQAGRRVWR